MTEFLFNTKLDQTVLLGISAGTVEELLNGIRVVPAESIYHHTHRFLLQHHFLSPEPPNDFAYWTTGVIGDDALGEQLASVDIMKFRTIVALRERFITIIAAHLESNGRLATAPSGEEFHFMASRTFVLPTPYVARSLTDFAEVLPRLSIHSLYYHIFDARLRIGRPENDFSLWFRENGYPELADEVRRLDPYSHTLETLRKRIYILVRKHDTH